MGHVSRKGPAFYALPSGGWRDYWTLLHPPYTVWHLSYVVMGACIVSTVNVRWLVETVVARRAVDWSNALFLSCRFRAWRAGACLNAIGC